MKNLKLLDTEKILFYFDHIRDGWNEYIYNSNFCRKKVRFTHEEQTNYVADLLNYFDDTIHLLSEFKVNDNYRSALYDNIAVLQIMYIQQDLTTELFQIFQIEKVTEENIIRYLRNELIGHPISRNTDKTKSLRSSVFITRETQGSTLQYILYHKKNDYKFELKTYQWQDLFAQHQAYLVSNFEILLTRIDEILKEFKDALINLNSTIEKSTISELIKDVETTFEKYHKNCPPYSFENISFNNSKLGSHPRYDLMNKMYLEGLRDSIIEINKFIDQFIQRKFIREVEKPSIPPIQIIFGNDGDQAGNYADQNVIVVKANKGIKSNSMHYEFSKLHNPEHPFGISYFLRKFVDDFEIMDELQNMYDPKSAEFHISYEYLRVLLQQRGLLD